MVAAMRTVNVIMTNFFSTLNTTGFLDSISCLNFGIKDNLLEKFDKPKTNQWNQQDINITDKEKQSFKNSANDIKKKFKYSTDL